MRSTLSEVARECGVNVSTVSRSLNHKYGVRAKTRAKILAVADRLGYRLNRIARGLATGRSQSLGFVVSDIRNPFLTEVARGAVDAAYAGGCDLIICNSDMDPEKQMRYVHTLLEKRVDGIVMNSVASLSREQQEEIVQFGIPVVLLSRQTRGPSFSSVTVDNFAGGMLAGNYLIGLGHRRIAHVTGHRSNINLRQRVKGFLKAVSMAGPMVTAIVTYGRHTSQGGHEMTKKVLAEHPEVTAIFAGNDVMAFGVMRAVFEMGLTIPNDISLVGFDNVEMAALTCPPLTTIHQPKWEMGKAAVEILLKLSKGADFRLPEHHQFGIQLMERHSCCSLREASA